MMRTIVLAALLTASLAAAASAAGIAGWYKVEGTNADGSPYGGVAEIVATGGSTCRIKWDTGSESSGICMRSGDAFSAAYQLGDKIGLVIYAIQPDGSMRGTWTIADSPGVGTEVLTPQKQ
jgi:hypothetical protein